MAFRWRADGGPLIAHKPKKKQNKKLVVKAANISSPERVAERLMFTPQCYLCLHLAESKTRYQKQESNQINFIGIKSSHRTVTSHIFTVTQEQLQT